MIAVSVDDVVALYDAWGGQRYDEEVTQREHAEQTAALAAGAGASDALVAAALLHDVGHLLELATGADGPIDDDLHHEARGARYLSELFPPAVTTPIALHVRAKRYLCAVDDGYRAGLSAGSERSLRLQGGALEPGEVEAFERLDGAPAAVHLRRWDDLGKVQGRSVVPLGEYRATLARVVVPSSRPRP
jgi:phosphonate degradation associated HDIG domain protein